MSNELNEGCVVCGLDVSAIEHKVAETMFRTGDTFTYRECESCGTMQIVGVPVDLARHYGPNYYSLGDPNGCSRLAHPLFRTFVGRAVLRFNTELFLRTGLGSGIDWTRIARMRTTDRILDIGCGGGAHLLAMHRRGFRHLAGADPFLAADTEVAPGVMLHKRRHDELAGRWDWVMMHHVFEHVPDPRAVLNSAFRLLSNRGRVLIRTPLIGGWAWRTYGVDWAQLDAPRHLVLLTLAGMRALVKDQGFRIERVVYDSTGFQAWGSELVRRRMPHGDGPTGFTAKQLAAWDEQAEELNDALDGDQAVIVLRSCS